MTKISIFKNSFVAFGLIVAISVSSTSGAQTPLQVGLSLLTEFFTVSLPLLRAGRTTASITATTSRVLLKLDREVGKTGIKISTSVPLGDFQALARATYAAQNGKTSTAKFDESSGIFIIVVHRGERTVFVSDAEQLCVANIAEPTLITVSLKGRYIEVPVSTEATDVMFGSSKADCEAIGRQIDRSKAQMAAPNRPEPIKSLPEARVHPGCSRGYEPGWGANTTPTCTPVQLTHPGCAKGFDAYWVTDNQPGCRPDNRTQLRQYISNFRGCVPTWWGQACGGAAQAELCRQHDVCD